MNQGPQHFTLLHGDDHLLVLDKPAGLLAVIGRGEDGKDNLASRVQSVHPEALIVHRLDMPTSGLMLMAQGAVVQRSLSMAFAARQVHKTYVAIVEGEVREDVGEIDAPLGADWPHRPRQKVDTFAGKPSLTQWRVLERLERCTRLALHPVTGRSHQLRVHLQHIGHPIRGDMMYAPLPARGPRLLLHASALSLRHPATGAALDLKSTVPF